MDRIKIIDVYERNGFRTIYEAINWSVGTDYTYWGRACWPSGRPQDGFRMWFTQLAHVEYGRYVSSANQCLNLICSDGNYHVFDDCRNLEPDVMNKQTWKYDLIFSKEVGGYYYFRGVFVEDTEHSKVNHYVSKRVATKVKLIGCPARRLELIDLVPDGIPFDEDYLKKQIISSDVIDTGPSVLSPLYTSEKPRINASKKTEEPVIDFKEVYPEGCRIEHRTFGVGTVIKLEDGLLTIKFEDGAVKELGAAVCYKMKLVKKLDE